MFSFLHISVKLILRQAATWSLIPTPFQLKVYLPLQLAGSTGLPSLLIIPDPCLVYIKGYYIINDQLSVDSFLEWESHHKGCTHESHQLALALSFDRKTKIWNFQSDI